MPRQCEANGFPSLTLANTCNHQIIQIANVLNWFNNHPVFIRDFYNFCSFPSYLNIPDNFIFLPYIQSQIQDIICIYNNINHAFIHVISNQYFLHMNYPPAPQQNSVMSPSNIYSKKNDLLKKIDRLQDKQKYKHNIYKLPQSPKTLTIQIQQDHLDLKYKKQAKSPQDQNQITASLRQQLMDIKKDVSKLMGKEKTSATIQRIKNKKNIMSPSSNDERSLASQDINMYRYERKYQGFRNRQDWYSPDQYENQTNNDCMSQQVFQNKKGNATNFKNKLSLKNPSTNYKQINQQRNFQKSPKSNWSPRCEQPSPFVQSPQLLQAQRTIACLHGIIDDSNVIRKGLQTKIASMKKKVQQDQDFDKQIRMRDQLHRQQQLRLKLQQKVVFLTKQIEVLQQQIDTDANQISRSKANNITDKAKQQERLLQKISIQENDSKMKQIQDAHNRQLIGVTTQLKLYKLNLQKQQSKCRKLQLQAKLLEQANKSQLKKNQITKVLNSIQTSSQTCQLQEFKQSEKEIEKDTTNQAGYIQNIRQQGFILNNIKCQLQERVKVLESENANILQKYQSLIDSCKSMTEIAGNNQQSYSLRQKTLNSLIIDLKTKISQLQGLNQESNKNIVQLRQKNNRLEQQIQQFEKNKTQLQTQIKVSQSMVKQLNSQIFNFAEQQKITNQKQKTLSNQQKKQIQKLTQNNRSLTQLYADKCKEDKDSKIQKQLTLSQLKDRNIYLEIENEKLHCQLEEQQYKFKSDLSDIKTQLQSRKYDLNDINQKGFDESLKQHLEEISKLKQEIQQKKELIIQLKEESRYNRTSADNIKAESQIQKLKAISERKNLSVAYEIQIQNLKNELNFQKKASSSLNTKLKLLNEQNKRKDQFLQKYVMGKSTNPQLKLEITQLFRRFQEQFNVDRLKQRVYEQTRVIQKLTEQNSILVSNICQLRSEIISQKSCKQWVSQTPSIQKIVDSSAQQQCPKSQSQGDLKAAGQGLRDESDIDKECQRINGELSTPLY